MRWPVRARRKPRLSRDHWDELPVERIRLYREGWRGLPEFGSFPGRALRRVLQATGNLRRNAQRQEIVRLPEGVSVADVQAALAEILGPYGVSYGEMGRVERVAGSLLTARTRAEFQGRLYS